jgi:lipid A 3-O-deacylase
MPINKLASLGILLASLAVLSGPALLAQTKNSAISAGSYVLDSPAQLLKNHAWEYGPFVQGGFGVGDRSSFHFFTVGAHAGKVLSRPFLPGVLRGQFEYAAELMPLWQAYTPAPHLQEVKFVFGGQTGTALLPYGGGTFTGASVNPIILRWNFEPTRRFVPWFQGAGGLIWTNHKFPPDILVPHGQSGGTSVFNFTPQFGLGFHYFVKPKRSITFAANAIHISSASLGDRNPGVNASVQFQLGYSWWK